MSEASKVFEDMTKDEKHFAHHFYVAVADDHVGFSVPKAMRYRLRELGLMNWKGGNYFETTNLLIDMMPLLNQWYINECTTTPHSH